MAEALDGNALAIVFSFLDIFTIVKLALVNKVWAKAVLHEKVASVLDVSRSSTITARVDIAKALPHLIARYTRGPGLRVLVLKGCYALKDEHLKEILELGANTLENINLDSCVALKSLQLLEKKPFLLHLRTLDVSRCRGVSAFPLISCPVFHALKASQCDGLLNLRDASNKNNFINFLQNTPSLTHLNLSGSHVSDAFLGIISQVTSLQHLNLNDCSTISSKGVAHLRNLTRLQNLDISWCNLVDDTGIVPAISNLVKLRELKLAQVYRLTDKSCRAMVNLTNLQVLDLEEDFNITQAGLESVFAISSLRHLTLRGISVDNTLLQQFKTRNPNCTIVSSVRSFFFQSPHKYELWRIELPTVFGRQSLHVLKKPQKKIFAKQPKDFAQICINPNDVKTKLGF